VEISTGSIRRKPDGGKAESQQNPGGSFEGKVHGDFSGIGTRLSAE
jgi:hypothetical protein